MRGEHAGNIVVAEGRTRAGGLRIAEPSKPPAEGGRALRSLGSTLLITGQRQHAQGCYAVGIEDVRAEVLQGQGEMIEACSRGLGRREVVRSPARPRSRRRISGFHGTGPTSARGEDLT